MASYTRSPSDGAHWLVEAGELEVGQGHEFYRPLAGGATSYSEVKDQPYSQRWTPRLQDATPALKAAHPDKEFAVADHGGHFYFWRLK